MADNHIIDLMFQVYADFQLLYSCDDFFLICRHMAEICQHNRELIIYRNKGKKVLINALVMPLFGNATNPIDVLRDPQKHPREIPRIRSIGKGSNSNLHKLSISIAQKRASAVTLKKKKNVLQLYFLGLKVYKYQEDVCHTHRADASIHVDVASAKGILGVHQLSTLRGVKDRQVNGSCYIASTTIFITWKKVP